MIKSCVSIKYLVCSIKLDSGLLLLGSDLIKLVQDLSLLILDGIDTLLSVEDLFLKLLFHLKLIFPCIFGNHFVLILDIFAVVFDIMKGAHDHFNSTNPLVLLAIDRHLFICVVDEVEVLQVVVITVEH